jgi:hypothetical protein
VEQRRGNGVIAITRRRGKALCGFV